MQWQEYLIPWNSRDEDQGRNTLNAWEKVKITVWCLSRDWILDNHPSPRPMLYNFPVNKDQHHMWHGTLVYRKTSLPTRQCPWLKPRTWGCREQWPENNAVYPATWHLCRLVSESWNSQVIEQCVLATPCHKHISARGWRDLAHTFIPLYSGFLKRTSWAQPACGSEPN